MKFYFRCPETQRVFASADYSLDEGYSIAELGQGDRELRGEVSLNSCCPLCGQQHRWLARDVMCSIPGGGGQ